MSLPPHREKDAKVEGRDPLETAPKQTMAPFRSLMGRLLKVKSEEMAEQDRLYESERATIPLGKAGMRKRPKLKHAQLSSKNADSPKEDRR